MQAIILSITVWPLFVAAIVSFVLMLSVVIYQSHIEKKATTNTQQFIEDLSPECDLALYLAKINNCKSKQELDYLDSRTITYYLKVKKRIGPDQAFQDLQSIDKCITNKQQCFLPKAKAYN
jgi:ABC-type transport system involved in multi-copper enzyme maturation permease subunit